MSTHVAIIARLNNPSIQRAVLVPPGQSIDFDEGSATRRWLHPYLAYEWHLVRFIEVAGPDPDYERKQREAWESVKRKIGLAV